MTKVIFYILLAGILYLPTIFPREMTNDEREKASQVFYDTHYEKCKDLISEEALEILRDGAHLDTDETRAYKLCCFKAFKWMVDSILNVEQMLNDAPLFIKRQLTPPESVAAKMILNYCKKEGEMHDTEMYIMRNFSKCSYDRIQNDM